MKKTDEIYLEIFSLDASSCLAPIETIVTLFTMKFCESQTKITLVKSGSESVRGYRVKIEEFAYEVSTLEEIPAYAKSCELPNVIVNDDSVVAGLCASLRQIVKSTIARDPSHRSRDLLGFKESCLLSPSESSVWTKYCEVDLISTLRSLTDSTVANSQELPASLARFECHMSQPVRLHNMYKYTMSKKFAQANGTIIQESRVVPEHLYAEGSGVTLADIIILVCVRILLNFMPEKRIGSLLPLTTRWYDRILENSQLSSCLTCIPLETGPIFPASCVLPEVKNQSLYKSDPKRYKPRNRIYTRQDDVENSLSLAENLPVELELEDRPFGAELEFRWEEIPYEATPDGGNLPATRLQRKMEQLENLCKPILKLARPGDVIVDFCSGGGHLGILVAHLLPGCTIILLENKEESLNRSKERVKKLRLTNVKFYQCNLDYFRGEFDIGTSLHACGVATDLVIQHCIRRNAIFVSCPCCYGSVHDCHHISYPRSEVFRQRLNNRDYLVLGHAADQTHDEKNAKTKQGNNCMAFIDTDRRLQAQEFGYTVHLAKLVPETCTPKNHLLVGIPKNRTTLGETTD